MCQVRWHSGCRRRQGCYFSFVCTKYVFFLLIAYLCTEIRNVYHLHWPQKVHFGPMKTYSTSLSKKDNRKKNSHRTGISLPIFLIFFIFFRGFQKLIFCTVWKYFKNAGRRVSSWNEIMFRNKNESTQYNVFLVLSTYLLEYSRIILDNIFKGCQFYCTIFSTSFLLFSG